MSVSTETLLYLPQTKAKQSILVNITQGMKENETMDLRWKTYGFFIKYFKKSRKIWTHSQDIILNLFY